LADGSVLSRMALKFRVRHTDSTLTVLMDVVVPCDCGTRFSFQVEPVAGRLPAGAELLCPACQKDGVPLANRVIGEMLRKVAAAQAALAPAEPKKKSIFGRSRETKTAQPPEPAYTFPDPFTKAGAKDDEIYTGPDKVKGMIGAVVGGAVGAAAWATIVYVTGYEIRYLAVGIGALVGYCSRKFGGGRDYHLGLFATVCALLAILVGQWFAANAFIKKFAGEFAEAQYQVRMETAKEAAGLKSDAAIKEFLAARDSSPFKAVSAGTVSAAAVAEFKTKELPPFKKFAAGDPSRAAFVDQERGEYLRKLGIKDIFIASITPYLFLWVFLGIGAAWKLASDYGTSVE
jgi:hypothetical protein